MTRLVNAILNRYELRKIRRFTLQQANTQYAADVETLRALRASLDKEYNQ